MLMPLAKFKFFKGWIPVALKYKDFFQDTPAIINSTSCEDTKSSPQKQREFMQRDQKFPDPFNRQVKAKSQIVGSQNR